MFIRLNYKTISRRITSANYTKICKAKEHKSYLFSEDNIWSADLADLQLIGK